MKNRRKMRKMLDFFEMVCFINQNGEELIVQTKKNNTNQQENGVVFVIPISLL